ncbi:hypothetical protein QYZ88_006440 [Lachnospiraceae bacterium C1.1]|nr:hypothetical protein [Lachnospiraceae bacterium C1.1]
MNAVGYDVAIPGNHEFDYGVDRFLELSQKADYPYISCNFRKNKELLFEPYTIIEKAGKKIGFVGVTTPLTITSSTLKYFKNEQGEFIYDLNMHHVLFRVNSAGLCRCRGCRMKYILI